MIRFGSGFVAVFLSLSLVACSSSDSKGSAPAAGGDGGTKDSTSTKDGGATKTASKPKTTPKLGSLTGLGGSKPPTGAKSQGTKSSPKVGGTTVPVQNVEVYLVAIDFDDDGSDDQLYWAHENGVTYLWAEGPIECADGLSDGTGGFIAVVKEDGSGSYMFAVDQCPEQNLFGCDFDANGDETACGACAWNEAVLVCAVAEGQ